MRILVQEPASKAFFDGEEWNKDATVAKAFESVGVAEAFCRERGLFAALIVVESKDGQTDISYPVGVRSAVLVSKPQTTKIKSLF